MSGEISSYDQANDYSQYLKVTGLNGAIPAGSIINGVEFTFSRRQSLTELNYDSRDLEVRMVVSGSVAGDNKAKGGDWPFASTPSVYGGVADVWGNVLTPAIINASDFGFVVANRVTFWQGTGSTIRASAFSVTVHYTPAVTGQKQVALTGSISSGVGAQQSDVALFGAISSILEKNVSLVGSIGPFLDLTNPSVDEVITSAGMTVTWDFGPTEQSDYRVQIWDNSSATGDPVYDSGVVGSTEQEHEIAPGQLPSGDLYIRVTGHDIDQIVARSALTHFETNFATSVNVSNVRVRVEGGRCEPDALPKIQVRWDEVVPGGGETFLQYDVQRRQSGTTTWTRISILDDIETLSYLDANVAPLTTYEYAVLWQATSGASTLISAAAAVPATGRLEFDWAYLHVADDFSRWVRLEILSGSEASQQNIGYFQPWGRSSPTVHVGEALNSSFSLPIEPQGLAATRQWTKIQDLLLAQQEGHVLCLRMGKHRIHKFVTIRQSGRQLSEASYEARIDLQETFYDEAVQT